MIYGGMFDVVVHRVARKRLHNIVQQDIVDGRDVVGSPDAVVAVDQLQIAEPRGDVRERETTAMKPVLAFS